MISTPRPPIIGFAAACAQVLLEDAKVSRFLDYGWFDGIRFIDGERVEMWKLRKSIPGHRSGETVTRQTLEKALFPALAGKYGSGLVDTGSADFGAVESPQTGDGEAK